MEAATPARKPMVRVSARCFFLNGGCGKQLSNCKMLQQEKTSHLPQNDAHVSLLEEAVLKRVFIQIC